MVNDWYTADKAHLQKALKMAAWRNADAKLEAADVQAVDELIAGRLFEPIGLTAPLATGASYLPKSKTTQYIPGTWDEYLYFQTAMNLYPAMGVCVTTANGAEVTSVTCIAAEDITTGDYFLIDCVNNAGATVLNYVWFNKAAGGGDPTIAGRIGIEIVIGASGPSSAVAIALNDKMDLEANYGASVAAAVVTITNTFNGAVDDAVDGNTDFSISVTTQGSCTHDITLRTGQTPTNQGRHWERENPVIAESERIDILGMMLNSFHVECSEASPVAVQHNKWGCSYTKNTGTDEITPAELADEGFKWHHFTFPTFTYNSEPIEATIIGWAFDVVNTIHFTGLDTSKRYSIGKYFPLTYIVTTLEITPYGHNIFELIRTDLASYLTDVDLVVKCARNATTDYIQWTHDKVYCQPFVITAEKAPGRVERYLLVLSQLSTGSITIQAKDQYDKKHYEVT